jgi:hypothetical protein
MMAKMHCMTHPYSGISTSIKNKKQQCRIDEQFGKYLTQESGKESADCLWNLSYNDVKHIAVVLTVCPTRTNTANILLYGTGKPMLYIITTII